MALLHPVGAQPPPDYALSRAPIAVVAVAAGVIAFSAEYLLFSEFSNDHYVHLAAARQIVAGDLPVRDFVDPGMPLMSGLSAIAQILLGDGLQS
jgi:hypothetical protein